jgi:hypothetical protein
MEHMSEEEYDEHVSDGEGSGEEESELKQEGESSQTSPSAASNTTAKHAPPFKQAIHLQKRRRVTRACDECRRKKIKCDGKQPCTHCTVYSYGECDRVRPRPSNGLTS